ncbi:MAG: aminotransferase class V-fold PLP-dependent enzyme, partial [Thermoplasmatota archaeon]
MNIDNIRKDFPLIEDYIYFDNACMTIKPYSVIEAMDEYYNSYPVCGGGRVPNVLTNKVDDKIRRGREAVKELINADSTEELVFTKNTTEGINLVSRGLNLEKGDVVLSTNKEHNSN